MNDALETYLQELRLIWTSGQGVKETSYYPALSALLNEAGKPLSPRGRCISQLANQGAGSPDFGLYDRSQFPGASEPIPMAGATPSRGVVEVKGIADDSWRTAEGTQVTRYWGHYGQVLVTNLRDFVLVGRDAEGKAAKLETYRLAASEAEFWREAAFPHAMAAKHGARFGEFLQRVLMHSAPLTTPRDLAWHLASYAREALARVEGTNLPALATVRTALEQALGLEFKGEKGEHFFRSTLVQTVFYGVFSAWVLWYQQRKAASSETFRWRQTSWTLHVPMVRALFDQIATPTQLGPLNMVEVLDWTEAALNRVDGPAFFASFEESHAVQYFYEPFLQAFDPALRKELGVWYTPPEIVQYMVERVDAVLRSELGVADGLADPTVYVLDPCAGTGSYIVEVLKRIEKTLRARGEDALVGNDIKKAAVERVFGFELLPAPFVISHLQIGLALQRLGAPLDDRTQERAGVYLTNALTGWTDGNKPPLPFPELEQERDAAGQVKRDHKILVILGNPPYNGYAGIQIGEERELSTAYREAKKGSRKPQGQGLNDLYVRFFRMAERRIVEKTGEGVICFVSNYSWLDGLSFPVMRERYLDAFDSIWIDNLNGDKYKTGKLTPEGEPGPSVFSTQQNKEGIQVGTAIALMVRKEEHTSAASVGFRNLWGRQKREDLLRGLEDGSARYEQVTPVFKLGLPFVPLQAGTDYADWPNLEDLFPKSYPGVKTSRDDFLVDIDRDRLVARLEKYFDPSISHEEMRRIAPGVMESVAGFKPTMVRDAALKRGVNHAQFVRFTYKPFDTRWLYWEGDSKLLDRPREDFNAQVWVENRFLEARQRQPMEAFDRGLVTSQLADNLGNGLSNYFPLYKRPTAKDLFDAGTEPNLSAEASAYLHLLRESDERAFYHAVTILHSPSFRTENAGALRQDWPRIPLPRTGERLAASAALGETLAALLDPEQAVAGVTAGAVRRELAALASITRVGGGALDPAAGDLAVTAGWGHRGQGGVVMPARGKAVERAYSDDERAAIDAGAREHGMDPAVAFACLGDTTFDIYLNDIACWRGVPGLVWQYSLGGYQVLKKWLSYREEPVVQRPLKAEEAREFTSIARRVAAILLLGPALDANYEAVKSDTYAWPAAK